MRLLKQFLIFYILVIILIMKINCYKSFLIDLPWLTLILGVFHLMGDLGRQRGYGQFWNAGLFLELFSHQYSQRKGASKFHFIK